MLERRRTLAAALAAIAFPVSGALPVAPSAAAPDLCLRTVSPEAPPVCVIPPMPPPRHEVRPPPPRVPAAGIGRAATGAGMAVAGFGSPGAGDGNPSTRVRRIGDRTIDGPSAASLSAALLSGNKTLLEGSVLRLPGLIDKKATKEPRARSGRRAESSIAADRAKYRAAARADGGAGQRALLRRRHIGAGGERHGGGRQQDQLFHGIPQW